MAVMGEARRSNRSRSDLAFYQGKSFQVAPLGGTDRGPNKKKGCQTLYRIANLTFYFDRICRAATHKEDNYVIIKKKNQNTSYISYTVMYSYKP